MIIFRIFLVVLAVLIPTAAFAWGPFTHMYLGSEIFFLGSLIPPAILKLMRRFREDFLYGNLMADTVIAKKYQPLEQHSHSWDIGFRLYDNALTDHERVFSLGYLSHLAADTVAHGVYTIGTKNLEHAMLEARADSLIDKDYWFLTQTIGRDVQRRNDIFLEKSLQSVFFSLGTNRKIFKGVVALSGIKKSSFGGVFDNHFLSSAQKKALLGLHEDSLDRILDVLVHGEKSEALNHDPIADVKPNRFFSSLLS